LVFEKIGRAGEVRGKAWRCCKGEEESTKVRKTGVAWSQKVPLKRRGARGFSRERKIGERWFGRALEGGIGIGRNQPKGEYNCVLGKNAEGRARKNQWT